jgi:hypothetical protein
MSALGQKQTSRSEIAMSALPPIADIAGHRRSQKQTFARLFDDLVRLGREIRRHLYAERLGGLEVDDELKFARLHHR